MTMINNNKPKTPSRLVHSITSGLKKGTKIFKKASRGINPNKSGKEDHESNRNNNNTAFGQRRRRRLRRRKKSNRSRGKNIERCESFSSPEQAIEDVRDLSRGSIKGVQRLSSRTKESSARNLRRVISYEEDEKDDLQALVLDNFENIVRQFLIYIGVYLLGALQPFPMLSDDIMFLFWHYLLVIWATCVFIKGLTYYVESHQEKDAENESLDEEMDEEILVSDVEEEEEEEEEEKIELLAKEDASYDARLEEEPILSQNTSEINHFPTLSIDTSQQVSYDTKEKEVDESEHSLGSENEEIMEHSWSQVEAITRNDQPQNHPELEDLFLIDKMNNTRLCPNGKPIHIENELFSGYVLLMFRTTDADSKEAPLESRGSASNDTISNYFRTKKRRFEIQLQFKFKKIPSSPLYLCLDLDEPLKLGLVQRAFVKATMNFVQQKNSSFTYNIFGDDNISDEDKAKGRYEKPRLTFPVESSLDRLVVTKPGEVPPKLGESIHEDPHAMEERMNGITYNLNDTYTFSVWSAYIDFLNWKVVNLPAIRPFSIANVNAAQPTSFRFYALNESATGHLQCDINPAVDIEISNRQGTTVGKGIKKWLEKRQSELLSNDNNIHRLDSREIEENYDYVYTTDVEELVPYEDDVDIDADPPSDSDLDIIEEVDEMMDPTIDNMPVTHNQSHQFFSPEEVKCYDIDTPAWIEMMHRKKRKLQRVYVVRMVHEETLDELNNLKMDEDNLKTSFHRLRTGKQLSELVRLGFELGMDSTDSNVDGFASIHDVKIKSANRRGKNQGDHHVAINKTLKEEMKLKSPKNRKSTKFHSFREDNCSIAAEMKPADQSCITLSKIFMHLSKASKTMINVRESLSNEISPITILDSTFLGGSANELGVVPATVAKGQEVFGDFIVARCLWESHWREEACVIFDNRIEFYAPMAKKPCSSMNFSDIKEVRLLCHLDCNTPLMLPQLVIETHWKCFYLAFCDVETRSNFHRVLNSTIFSTSSEVTTEQDQWRAHFWQGFHFMTNISSSTSRWTKISSSKKQHHRMVLNNRRMSFDCEDFNSSNDSPTPEISVFVQDLLRMSLSFTSENLETSPDDFIKFQDRASRLKNLPLQKLDRSDNESFCIWVNLYHCLLQHSLLLSSRAPTKKSISTFLRTRCYEIGGDVFSLAEIERCVIRGNMNKGFNVKAPFVREPKKSKSHYRYALYHIDPRINFVLNTGEKTKPREIPILSPNNIEEQLDLLSTQFLKCNISVDYSKKILTLPRICEVYKKDFGEDPDFVNSYLMRYLSDVNVESFVDFSDGNVGVKYDPYPDSFYSSLRLLH